MKIAVIILSTILALILGFIIGLIVGIAVEENDKAKNKVDLNKMTDDEIRARYIL